MSKPHPKSITDIAEREGLDIDDLTRSNANGTANLWDVRAWRKRGADARALAAAGQARAKQSLLVEDAKASHRAREFAARAGRPIFARNPRVEQIRAEQSLVPTTPAPTLFASGDLPPYTASGNDPAELALLPWQLRHAAARADQAEWSRLFAEYARADVESHEFVFEPAVADVGNLEYEQRVKAWRYGEA